MPVPTGKQWVRLYRGLANTTPENVDTRGIGPHWTTDAGVAYNFATNRDVEGYPLGDSDSEFEGLPAEGTVVEALIHRRHIVDPESEEGQHWQNWSGVLGPEHPEQEKTIRGQATVHIQRMHWVNDDTNEDRMVTYPKGLKSRGRA